MSATIERELRSALQRSYPAEAVDAFIGEAMAAAESYPRLLAEKEAREAAMRSAVAVRRHAHALAEALAGIDGAALAQQAVFRKRRAGGPVDVISEMGSAHRSLKRVRSAIPDLEALAAICADVCANPPRLWPDSARDRLISTLTIAYLRCFGERPSADDRGIFARTLTSVRSAIASNARPAFPKASALAKIITRSVRLFADVKAPPRGRKAKRTNP